MTRPIHHHSESGALSDAERLRFARRIIVEGGTVAWKYGIEVVP